jgi:esterase/lipase superfamily enzyme
VGDLIVDRVQVALDAPDFDRSGTVIRYGHWGRPMRVFPSEQAASGTTRTTAWSAQLPISSTPGGSTGSLPSARQMAGLLADKGIPHELDVWGHDSAHDWDWWQRQVAHHLPRFC